MAGDKAASLMRKNTGLTGEQAEFLQCMQLQQEQQQLQRFIEEFISGQEKLTF